MKRARSSLETPANLAGAQYMWRDFLQQIDIRVLKGSLSCAALYVDEPIAVA